MTEIGGGGGRPANQIVVSLSNIWGNPYLSQQIKSRHLPRHKLDGSQTVEVGLAPRLGKPLFVLLRHNDVTR